MSVWKTSLALQLNKHTNRRFIRFHRNRICENLNWRFESLEKVKIVRQSMFIIHSFYLIFSMFTYRRAFRTHNNQFSLRSRCSFQWIQRTVMIKRRPIGWIQNNLFEYLNDSRSGHHRSINDLPEPVDRLFHQILTTLNRNFRHRLRQWKLTNNEKWRIDWLVKGKTEHSFNLDEVLSDSFLFLSSGLWVKKETTNVMIRNRIVLSRQATNGQKLRWTLDPRQINSQLTHYLGIKTNRPRRSWNSEEFVLSSFFSSNKLMNLRSENVFARYFIMLSERDQNVSICLSRIGKHFYEW